MMKRALVLALAATLISTTAHAQLLTGIVVGHLLTSGKAKSDTVVVFSEKNDVVACPSRTPGRCYKEEWGQWRGITPAEFAGSLGYKTLHKTGVMNVGDQLFIIMEVSK